MTPEYLSLNPCGDPCDRTMSDQEFETFREFVILDFLASLKTPILQKFPEHLWVLFKYNCQVFWEGELMSKSRNLFSGWHYF